GSPGLTGGVGQGHGLREVIDRRRVDLGFIYPHAVSVGCLLDGDPALDGAAIWDRRGVGNRRARLRILATTARGIRWARRDAFPPVRDAPRSRIGARRGHL